MDLRYQHIIPTDFDSASRVWVYQSNTGFTTSEASEVEEILNQFVAQWKSHGAPVKGYANLLFGHFILIMADETATGVSGCSTDSSVRVMKQIEEQFKVNMFDRQLLAFIVNDQIQMLPLSQLKYAAENGFISCETLYFNNLVSTKQELLDKWIVPVQKSWLSSKIKFPEKVS
jgi:hypothetical protein